MPADGPPTRGTADTDDTAAVEEKAQGLGVPAADASPAGVSVKIADDENVSSEAQREDDEAARRNHIEGELARWETAAKAELQAVIDDAGTYAPAEITARIKRAQDILDGLKAHGLEETNLNMKLIGKSIKRAEAAAAKRADQGDDGSAQFISSDKAGTSSVFGATEAQKERYDSLRQKTDDTSVVGGLTIEEAADKIEVNLPFCCMGQRWFVYVLAVIILVVPVTMCSFMMNATYTAFYKHHICTGPELTGGMLQSIWYMAFLWILVWVLIKGALKGESGEDAEYMNCCIVLPFVAIATGVASVFVALLVSHSSGTTSSGDEGGAIVGLWIGIIIFLTVIQLCMVCLWPFLGPIIFLSVILNLDTRTEYYKFDLYYGNDIAALNQSGLYNRTTLSEFALATQHILETSPVGMENWPSVDDPELDSVIKTLYEFPGLEIINGTRVGGWPKEPPNGVAGLVDGVLMRKAGWCGTARDKLPDFIDFLYQNVGDSSNPQGKYSNYKLPGAGGYDNCTELFKYRATPSANNEFYDVKGMPATYCQPGATMPECCDIVTNLAASSTAISVVLCMIGVVATLSIQDKNGVKKNPLIGMFPLLISLPSLALGWSVYSKA